MPLLQALILKYTSRIAFERQAIARKLDLINSRARQGIEFNPIAINDAITTAVPIRKLAYVSSVAKKSGFAGYVIAQACVVTFCHRPITRVFVQAGNKAASTIKTSVTDTKRILRGW
jgi:hypothetical protein